MIKLKELLSEEIFTDPTDSRMTSIRGKVTYGVKWLFNKGAFDGMIIDYGCGRYDRNASFLREHGLKVYSYDKFWGKSTADGYTEPSNVLPSETFDVGFTSFVLNVVNISEEQEILQWMNSHCKTEYHITRNQDIKDMIIAALQKKNNTISNFFTDRFKGDISNITEKDIDDFSTFGTKTNMGFQRIPELQFKGYKILKLQYPYKIYKRE